MQVVLVMFRSDGERRSFSVVRNMTVIGRREDCDLRIPVGDVSRKHCRLVRTDDGIRIEDLGSSNGTYVNGQRVQESELNPGDHVGVGPVQFIVQINGVPEDDEMLAPGSAPPAHSEDTAVSEVPAEELEEVPLEELQEETPLEEVPLEEVSPEQVTLDEVSLEEAPLEEVHDEVTLDEVPEEVPPEEVSLEELHEVEAAAPAPVEELEEVHLEDVEEVPSAAAATINGRPSSPPPLPPLPPSLPPMPTAIEPEPAPAPQPQPAVAAEAADEDADWDFVIEETESDRSHTDFQVDLDTPHK